MRWKKREDDIFLTAKYKFEGKIRSSSSSPRDGLAGREGEGAMDGGIEGRTAGLTGEGRQNIKQPSSDYCTGDSQLYSDERI